MTESTVWRVMHPDGSRTVVGHYPLALAYAKGDRSRIDEITLELHPGPLALLVLAGGFAWGGLGHGAISARSASICPRRRLTSESLRIRAARCSATTAAPSTMWRSKASSRSAIPPLAVVQAWACAR